MSNKNIIILAGAGLLAYALLQQKAMARPVAAYRPVPTKNQNPLFNLALPTASMVQRLVQGYGNSGVPPTIYGNNLSGVPGVYPGSQQDILLQSQWNPAIDGWNSMSGVSGVTYGSEQDMMLADQWS